MRNALSVDLEDWFCVHNLTRYVPREDWDTCECHVAQTTGPILDLFDQHEAKATFFVLGGVAERAPDLVRVIAARGHEIATHGYGHRLLTDMTPQELAADLGQALTLTRGLVEQDVIGFRAPSFSLTRQTMWAVDILLEQGLRYDSSVFPVAFHPDYGIPDAPLTIHELPGGLWEFPLTVVDVLGQRLPAGGGGYFRLMPYALTRTLLRRCNREGRPAVCYFHPWETDREQPRVRLPLLRRFRQYHGIAGMLGKLDALLRDFAFAPLREVIGL